MNRRLPLAAILLSLLVLPAHAGSASARMEVSFVVKAACTVSAPGQASTPGVSSPDVSCNDATPFRVAPAAAADGAGWTVTF